MSLNRLFPLLVVVPPQIGNSPALVSRPLWGCRSAETAAVLQGIPGVKPHPVAPPGMPWVAVANGVRGDEWMLVPRTAAGDDEVDAAIDLHDKTFAWTWNVELGGGWFRKKPRLLRGVANPDVCAGLPPTLAADLGVALLLNRLALIQAAGMLESLSLLAVVRGRNELFIAAGAHDDPHAATALIKHAGPPGARGLTGDLVLCIEVRNVNVGSAPRSIAPIVTAMGCYPDGSLGLHAYDALAGSDW